MWLQPLCPSGQAQAPSSHQNTHSAITVSAATAYSEGGRKEETRPMRHSIYPGDAGRKPLRGGEHRCSCTETAGLLHLPLRLNRAVPRALSMTLLQPGLRWPEPAHSDHPAGFAPFAQQPWAEQVFACSSTSWVGQTGQRAIARRPHYSQTLNKF